MERIRRDIFIRIKNTTFNSKEKFFCMLILNDLYNTQLAMLKEDPGTHGYVNKHFNYFRNITGNDSYRELLSEMSRQGLLEINEKYCQDRYTKSYKPQLTCSTSYITINEIQYLTSKELANWRKRKLKMKDKYKEANWHLRNLCVTLEVDIQILKTLYFYRLGVMLKSKNHKDLLNELMNLNIKGLSKKDEMLHKKTIDLLDLTSTTIKIGSKSGRHYHALSNAPKDLRMCLKSKDPKRPYLLELDIKNSQPTILLGLCNKKKLEVEEIISCAIQRGEFYELIGESWGYLKEDITTDYKVRGEVKKKVFQYLFFATSFENDKFKSFETKLPMFAKAIKTLATKDPNKTLASQLQQKESEIMLPITKEFKGVGIHDSIIIACVKDSNEGFEIEDKIKTKFKELGVRVRVDSKIIQPIGSSELLKKITGYSEDDFAKLFG